MPPSLRARREAYCTHGSRLLQAWWLFAFGGLGWVGFSLLLFSSFPPQGLADPSVCSGVHALRLLSAKTSLSLFLLTPVAARGGYSQPINIEIQLDACSLGGETACFVPVLACHGHAQNTGRGPSHRGCPPQGPELSAKSPASFRFILFCKEN